jgi:hypothetical protein
LVRNNFLTLNGFEKKVPNKFRAVALHSVNRTGA